MVVNLQKYEIMTIKKNLRNKRLFDIHFQDSTNKAIYSSHRQAASLYQLKNDAVWRWRRSMSLCSMAVTTVLQL